MTIAILLFRFEIFIVYCFIDAPGRVSLNLYTYIIFLMDGAGEGGKGGQQKGCLQYTTVWSGKNIRMLIRSQLVQRIAFLL